METLNFSDFLQDLDLQCKKLFKSYEKISYKIINATNAIKFNNICLQERLCQGAGMPTILDTMMLTSTNCSPEPYDHIPPGYLEYQEDTN